MLRLLLIAVTSLASFFVFLWLISMLTGDNDLAAWIALLLGFVGVPVGLLRVFGSNPATKCPEGKGLYPECKFIVRVSETNISVQRPDGQIQMMPISELQEVTILTNDSGPWNADVWWVFTGKTPDADCIFPNGATGEQDVLQFVQNLPGFDNKRFVQAMGSTSNARFSCWNATSASTGEN